MAKRLVINEIYLSLQGESRWAGWPCIFIRLTACNLRCSYCDTAYAFAEGKPMDPEEVLRFVNELARPFEHQTAGRRLPLVELTGGEPLLQPAVLPLMTRLCDRGFRLLLETSGAHEISQVDPRVHRIVDIKTPSSGEADKNRWDNLPFLNQADELKCVISTQEDYAWAKEQLANRRLTERCPVLFSWAAPLQPHQRDPSLKPVPREHTPISRQQLVEQIIRDALPVRFQLQMHKIIWPPDQRGV